MCFQCKLSSADQSLLSIRMSHWVLASPMRTALKKNILLRVLYWNTDSSLVLHSAVFDVHFKCRLNQQRIEVLHTKKHIKHTSRLLHTQIYSHVDYSQDVL